MEMTRTGRRWIAWIACLAILMASFAPSLAHTLAASGGAGTPWGEVCTTLGASPLKAGSASKLVSSAPDQKVIHLKHCPLCLTHAASFALPSASHSVLPAVNASYPLPVLFYQSSRPLFAWSAAQARAPPVLS